MPTSTIQSYNAFFIEPPEDSINKIGVSSLNHPAILSIVKPGAITISSIFLLLNTTSSTSGENVINELQVSIIPIDDDNGYLPSNHEASSDAAKQNANSFKTYIENLQTGYATATAYNINFLGTQRWLEFKFSTPFVINNPNDYFGIMISDTSNSKNINNILYTDRVYNQYSINRTLYLMNNNGQIDWQLYQVGNNNIQVCICYQSSEITSTSGLNYGTISTGGPNSRRNSGLGFFIKNTSSSSYFTLNNFAPVPLTTDEGEIGAENFTFNSNFNWTYFDKNTIPSSKMQILYAKTASNSLNIEIGPGEFIFLYQQDWVAPLPVRYSSISDRRLLYINGPTETETTEEPDDALRGLINLERTLTDCKSTWTVVAPITSSLTDEGYTQIDYSGTDITVASFVLPSPVSAHSTNGISLYLKTSTNSNLILDLYEGNLSGSNLVFHIKTIQDQWCHLNLLEYVNPGLVFSQNISSICLSLKSEENGYSFNPFTLEIKLIKLVNFSYSSKSRIYNPMSNFPLDSIKVQSENINNILTDNTNKARVFSTLYPNRVISYDSTQDIRPHHVISSNNIYNFNNFTIERYQHYPANSFNDLSFCFGNSSTGLDFDDEFFADNTYYFNSKASRDQWNLFYHVSAPYEYNSTSMLLDYGIEINSDSTNKNIILNNTKLFPDSSSGAKVTDIRSVNFEYRNAEEDGFMFNRNNTLNMEKIPPSNKNTDRNALSYRLIFHESDVSNDFPNPPHLILRNYSTGSIFTDNQNLLLGGVCLYTGVYSSSMWKHSLNLSQFSDDMTPNPLVIVEDDLATCELPISKSFSSDASSIYGKGLTITIHSQDNESLLPSNGENFIDTKYLIRHIIDGVITIEGKVLSYGLCKVSLINNDYIRIELVNTYIYQLESWPNLGGSYICLNPFGFSFSSDGDTIESIVNNGQPHDCIEISNIIDNIVTTTHNASSFWNDIFPNNAPNENTVIPFYILDIPAIAPVPLYGLVSSIFSTQYGLTMNNDNLYPEFFHFLDTTYVPSGHLLNSSGEVLPSYYYYYADPWNRGVLPFSSDYSDGYSVTFPYFTDINNLTDLPWLDILFSGLSSVTNLDIKENDTVLIYDNPVEKFRTKYDNENHICDYYILEPLSSAKNPENIFDNIKSCDFQNDLDCAQIHISEKEGGYNNSFRFMSFMYSVDIDTTSTDISSVCELTLKGHKNGFIIEDNNPEVILIPNISLNVTGDTTLSQVDTSSEAIYSYEFDSPVIFNDLILQRTGGDVSARINNFTLFNDMAIYGKCINPINAWRNEIFSYCELQPNGYLIIDLGYSRRIYSLDFVISKNDDAYERFDDNSVLFSILTLDPNVSNNFNEIVTTYNKNDDKIGEGSHYSSKSFITSTIDRTAKYILIKPLNSGQSIFINNLVVGLEDLDIPYYISDSLNGYFTKELFLPTSNISYNSTTRSVPNINVSSGLTILNPVSQPKNYKYITYPYDDSYKYCTMRPKSIKAGSEDYFIQISEPLSRYDSAYIPVGNTNNYFSKLFYYFRDKDINDSTYTTEIKDIDNVLVNTSPITQVCFNIKYDNSKKVNNNGSLFKLYYSNGTGVSSEISPNYLSDPPIVNDSGTFNFVSSIFAVPYSREPEEGFYTIASMDNRYIYLDSSDIIFANNNLSGYMVRLDVYRDVYAVVRRSDIDKSGRAYIEVNSAVSSLGLIPGGQCYFERSNVISLPAFDATWLKLEYINTSHSVNVFGFKTFVPVTSTYDNIYAPTSIPSSFNWDFEINYIED